MTTTSELTPPSPSRGDDSTADKRPFQGHHVVLIALIVFGVALRAWLLVVPLGTLDSDSAVPGLMALHLKEGEFSTFYWGQAYGGSIESLLAALAFVVVPASPVVLKLVPMLLSGLAAFLTWRIGRRLVGERAAQVGAVLFWISPASFVSWSTKMGTYWASLCLALLAVLLLLLLHDDETWRPPKVAAFGFVLGLAWWANIQTAYLLLPACAYFFRSFWRNRTRLPLLAATAALGAAPWLLFSIRNHWVTLDPPDQPAGVSSTYLDHLSNFVTHGLPMVLGVRKPSLHGWVLPPLGQLAYATILLALVAALVMALRRRRADRLLILCAAVFPFLFALSPGSWFEDEPRYLLLLWPTLALLLGQVLVLWRLWLPGLCAAALACSTTLAGLNAVIASKSFDGVPADLGPARQLLAEHGVLYAFADYWLAYRLTFETRERVTVTPVELVRYLPYHHAVHASPNPAYIFLVGSDRHAAFKRGLAALGVGATEDVRGSVVVVKPARKVVLSDLPGVRLGDHDMAKGSGAMAGGLQSHPR